MILAVLALVWGSSYILIKKALVGLDAFQIGFLRITLAGLAFWPLAWYRSRKLGVATWLGLIVVGLFGTGFPSFLFPMAQRELSSSVAAALSSLTPLMTLLVATLLSGKMLSASRALGIVLGLAGALTLIAARFGGFSLEGSGYLPWGAVFLAVLATLSYALSSNLVKLKFGNIAPLTVSASAISPLAIVGLIGLVFVPELPEISYSGVAGPGPQTWSYMAVIFLGLIATAYSSFLFFKLIQVTDAVFASTVSYVVPIIALVWGLLDGEMVSLGMMGAIGLILAGIYLSRT